MHCSILNILFLLFVSSLLSFCWMPTQDQKCCTNICLLFYLNPRTVHMHIVYRFAWSPQMTSSHLFLMIWLQTHLLYSIFFFSFKVKRVSKWYCLDDHNRISNKQMFYVSCSELTNTSHGLYECLYNIAKRVLAKAHPSLTLRSVGKLWNYVANYGRVKISLPSP